MALEFVEARMIDGKVHVTVKGDGIEEVSSMAAKRMAIEKSAACGYPMVGYSGSSGAYPVDAEGKHWEDVNAMAKEGKIVAYCNDLILMPRM